MKLVILDLLQPTPQKLQISKKKYEISNARFITAYTMKTSKATVNPLCIINEENLRSTGFITQENQ